MENHKADMENRLEEGTHLRSLGPVLWKLPYEHSPHLSPELVTSTVLFLHETILHDLLSKLVNSFFKTVPTALTCTAPTRTLSKTFSYLPEIDYELRPNR